LRQTKKSFLRKESDLVSSSSIVVRESEVRLSLDVDPVDRLARPAMSAGVTTSERVQPGAPSRAVHSATAAMQGLHVQDAGEEGRRKHSSQGEGGE